MNEESVASALKEGFQTVSQKLEAAFDKMAVTMDMTRTLTELVTTMRYMQKDITDMKGNTEKELASIKSSFKEQLDELREKGVTKEDIKYLRLLFALILVLFAVSVFGRAALSGLPIAKFLGG